MIGTRIPFGCDGVRPRVLVSVPTTGWIHKHTGFALLRIALIESSRQVVSGDIIMPTHVPYENNLHHIVRDILQKDYDFWVSFDADNPPRTNLIPLVLEDKDVIGCPTPVWHFEGKPGERPMYWNGYDYVPEEDAYGEHNPKESLQRVDAVGTGCFVVARRVLEHPDMQTGCFAREYYSDGTVHKGNDLMFCERARAVGFEVYAHYDYPCFHFNEIEVGEVSLAIQALMEKGDV